jgi:hypothetical protein
MEALYSPEVLDLARQFAAEPVLPENAFSLLEKEVLGRFCTNLTKRVFIIHSLPETLTTPLLSMYSRLKDPRGIRGTMLSFFLQLIASRLLDEAPELAELYKGNEKKYLEVAGIHTLDDFVRVGKVRSLIDSFLGFGSESEDLEYYSNSPAVARFLTTWLDKYGHNSIARMAKFIICFEQVTLVAAKTLEWGRPGSGFIELSTRYVNMGKKGLYKLAQLLEKIWGVPASRITEHLENAMDRYQKLSGPNMDGPFPQFLRKTYGPLYSEDPKGLEAGIFGETCDVLGNLLPAAAYTSVAAAVAGEALSQLVKHLYLDNTPETIALAQLVQEECCKVGANRFLSHSQPTEWERYFWEKMYLRPKQFNEKTEGSFCAPCPFSWSDARSAADQIVWRLGEDPAHVSIEEILASAPARGEYDKLPRAFETGHNFTGVMSFRGWRDLHRMGLCTHQRTRITTELGYYAYDKPAPAELNQAFQEQQRLDHLVSMMLKSFGVPAPLAQYPLTLGNRVGFLIGANLRQWEFANWQRSKWGANHEVRNVFLDVERNLRSEYPWLAPWSRADTTPAYVFARGAKPLPLPETQRK